jgi:hypothetical protein
MRRGQSLTMGDARSRASRQKVRTRVPHRWCRKVSRRDSRGRPESSLRWEQTQGPDLSRDHLCWRRLRVAE